MKIKILTFANGQQEFSTSNVEIRLNGQDPTQTDEVEMPDTDAKAVLDSPKTHKVMKDKNNKVLIVKK